MGSGHILVYAFDVLMQIYESTGVSQRDAAQSILQNNLFGLDIDPRAAQLAYFAVMMKARQYDRRIFSRGIQPNLYSAAGYPEGEEFGSLITVDKLEEKPQPPTELSLFDGKYEDKLNAWNFRRLLAQKYDVVFTNPPYMGASNMNAQLSEYIKKNYADYKSDFFSAFMVRCTQMVKPQGYLGFFTPYVWMFIQSYEKLRRYLCTTKTIETLIQFEYSAFEEATVPVCTFAFKNSHINKKGCYFRLTDFRGGMEVQRQKTLEAIANHDCGFYYEQSTDNFSKIPGSPIAYWVSEQFVVAFENSLISNIAFSDGQILTGNNNIYLRLLWEVDNLSIKNRSKWALHAKGGEQRRWYGNIDTVVAWTKEAINHYKTDNIARFPKNNILFRTGIT